jgi:hypothetical protein
MSMRNITYPPIVAGAVQRGDVASATEHYVRSGAAEGRVPSGEAKPEIDAWISVLRVYSTVDA